MPRRSNRAKPEDPNVEKRVTRRSLRSAGGEESPQKAAKEVTKPRGREPRGRSSSSKRGRGAAEEDVEEDKSVGEPETEAAATEVASPRAAKSPARGRAAGRGRSRGRSPRGSASQAAADEEEGGESAEPPKATESPARPRRSRSAQSTPQKESTPTRGRRGRSSVTEQEAASEEPTNEEKEEEEKEADAPAEPESKKRKRDEEEEEEKKEEEQSEKKQKVDGIPTEETPTEPTDDAKPADEPMETEAAVAAPDVKDSAEKVEPEAKEPVAEESDKAATTEQNVTKEEPMKEEEQQEAPKPETEPKAESEPKAQADSKAEAKPKAEAETKTEAKPEAEPKADVEPSTEEAPMETASQEEKKEVMETETTKTETSAPADVLKDYVVVNMEDVPASDSAEVTQSVPVAEAPSSETPAPSVEPSEPTTDGQPAAPKQPSTTEAPQHSTVPPTEVANGSTHLTNSTEMNSISNGGVSDSATDSSVDPLFSRKFVSNPNLAPDCDQSQKFTLVSYNILADCHIRKDSYPWQEEGKSRMEFRHKRLLQELQYLDADIVCLQEVEPDYYNNILAPTLKTSGYDGVFKKRGDPIEEGEATFFRTSKFSLVTHRGVSLRDLAFKELEACGLESGKAAAVKAFVDVPAVVLITQLKSSSSGKVVTVGNIHATFDPVNKQDLQCIQISCALKEIVALSDGPSNSHVICGDFNAWPETTVYQLTKEGYLNDASTTTLQGLQNVNMQDGTKQALVNLWWKGFQHTSSGLRSCYNTAMGKEPVSTCYSHSRQTKNVDYIWCGGSGLEVAGVLQTCPEHLVSPGIPNDVFPSDHLSLKAALFFK